MCTAAYMSWVQQDVEFLELISFGLSFLSSPIVYFFSTLVRGRRVTLTAMNNFWVNTKQTFQLISYSDYHWTCGRNFLSLVISFLCARLFNDAVSIGVTYRRTIRRLPSLQFSWRNIKITNVAQQNGSWPHTDCNQTALSFQSATLPLLHSVELSCISNLHNTLFVRLRCCFTRYSDISRYDAF